MLFFATVTARKAFEGGKDMVLKTQCIIMHNARCTVHYLWHVEAGKKEIDKLIRGAVHFGTRQYCSIYLQYAVHALCTV